MTHTHKVWATDEPRVVAYVDYRDITRAGDECAFESAAWVASEIGLNAHEVTLAVEDSDGVRKFFAGGYEFMLREVEDPNDD